ncbi:UNVERIFIED_CONTAM: hypothetical protein NCL1_20141 [Trichonephila clavipes]
MTAIQATKSAYKERLLYCNFSNSYQVISRKNSKQLAPQVLSTPKELVPDQIRKHPGVTSNKHSFSLDFGLELPARCSSLFSSTCYQPLVYLVRQNYLFHTSFHEVISRVHFAV